MSFHITSNSPSTTNAIPSQSNEEEKNFDQDVNAADDRGVTLLHRAASRGNLKAVELLLNRGAQINSADRWGSTPLHYATGQNHPDVLELLLNRGAAVNSKNAYGNTALQCALTHSRRTAAFVLLEKGAIIEDISSLPPYQKELYNQTLRIATNKVLNQNLKYNAPQGLVNGSPSFQSKPFPEDLIGIILDYAVRPKKK